MKSNQTQQGADRQFRALTSLSQTKFERLLQVFAPLIEDKLACFTLKGKPRTRILPGELKSCSLQGSRLKLMFILMYLKENPRQCYHGFAFEMSQSKVSEWVKFLTPLLEQSLKKLEVCPQTESFDASLEPETAFLIVDVTERKVPRRIDYEAQKEEYSGKKKCHTIKNLAITDHRGYVVFVSEAFAGRVHDKAICDQLMIDPADYKILADLGFSGIEKTYPNVMLPYKKPKGGELAKEEKAINRSMSQLRVKVEHAIGGIKRLLIIRNTIRLKTEEIRDTIMRIATGLHNLRMTG